MQFSGAIQGDSMQGTVTMSANRSYDNAGGYPGGGYPRCPGGGYPGGGRTRTGRDGSGATTQVHWNAQRNNGRYSRAASGFVCSTDSISWSSVSAPKS